MNFRYFFILLSLPVLLSAQEIDPIQYPPNVRWKQIKSPHFTIVVPDLNVSDGQRVANIMENMYYVTSKSLNDSARRYNIILSNQNITANGYVTILPRKSEFYSTPIQYGVSGTNEWYFSLAIHEGRHMVQFDKLRRGEPGEWYFFWGNYGLMVYDIFTMPLWIAEGDAVLTETAHSRSGRGRLPSFDMGIRAKLLSGEKYGYYRAYNRSFKNYYPNHYALGYQLIKYGRAQFRNSLWSDVSEAMVQRNYMLISSGSAFWNWSLRPFYKQFKNLTGHRIRKFHKNAFAALESDWRQELIGLSFTEYIQWNNKKKRGWTNYDMPVFENDHSIIAYKMGLGNVQQFVRIRNNGLEEKITEFMPNDMTRTSYSAGKLCWTEEVPDLRWGNRSYGKVVVYDIKSKSKKYLGFESKYISACLSPNGDMVAAVNFNMQRQCRLLILDSQSGRILQSLENPENDLITFPIWSPDSKQIAFTHTGAKGKALSVQNITEGTIATYIPYGHEDIASPVFCDKYILYNSPYSGIDNIYAIDTQTLQRFQITCAKFGAFNPAVSADLITMVYSDYTAQGFNAVSATIDPAKWIPIEQIKVSEDKMLEKAIANEPKIDVIDSLLKNEKVYPEKKYSKLTHSINPFSWYIGPTINQNLLNVGLHAQSQDILNNLDISIGYDFSLFFKTNVYSGGFQYKGLYPIFGSNIVTGQMGSFFEDPSDPELSITRIWDQTSVQAFINQPINISRGIYNRQILAGLNAAYFDLKNYPEEIQGTTSNQIIYSKIKFTTLQYNVSFQNHMIGSSRDFNPRWGQEFTALLTHSPDQSNFKGLAYAAQAQLYVPGLFNHHSLHIAGSVYQQEEKEFPYAYPFDFTRGYIAATYFKAKSVALDYSFPLLYPDIALGGFMYIKRIRGQVNYDYSYGNELKNIIVSPIDYSKTLLTKDFIKSSVGATIFFDFTPFALPPQLLISLGVSTYMQVESQDIVVMPALKMKF